MMNLTIDTTKGFDVMRGKKLIEHFDSYDRAWEYAREHHFTVRYWALQPTAAAAEARK